MPYGDTGQQQPYHGGYPAPPVAYAGWVARVAGYLIDGLIVGALPIALTVIAAAAFVEEPSVDPETLAHDPGGVQTPGIVLYIAAAVIALITGLWMLHKEGTTGQSVGKKTLNIRLLREPDMQPLGFGGAFGRKLAHVLDSMA
ncbi:MAG: RDD family protein, partial [Thermocrispum sp.]